MVRNFGLLFSPFNGQWVLTTDPQLARWAKQNDAQLEIITITFDHRDRDAVLFDKLTAAFRQRRRVSSWQAISEIDLAEGNFDRAKTTVLIVYQERGSTLSSSPTYLRFVSLITNCFVFMRSHGYRTKICLLEQRSNDMPP